MDEGQDVNAAAAHAAGMDAAGLQRAVDFLDRTYLNSGAIPHYHLLASRGEQVVVDAVRGKARETGEPLQWDSLYRIASMTKPVTSVAFMMMVEEGRVALDDPVETVLPEFAGLTVGMERRAPDRPMLMIDLLRHTSGLTYGLQRQTPIDAIYRERGLDEFQQNRSSDEFIAALADIPLEFSPGDKWNYSVSTDVLGVVVERLAGMDLEDMFRARIFEPLGMTDSFFRLPEDRTERMTDAWQLTPERTLALADRGARSGWRRPQRFYSGGGGLVSSTADYHRFARMLLRGGELDGARLLRADTVERMRSNHLPGDRDLTAMSTAMFSEAGYAGVGFGLGFAMTQNPSLGVKEGSVGEYYWGGIFSTYFFIDPVENLIILFMTQHLPSTIYPVRAEIRSLVQSALVQRNGG